MLFARSEVPNPLNIINSYEEEWGLQLPLPDEREEIWSSEASSHGDGEWINVFYYNAEQNLDKSNMIPITDEDVTKVNNQIQNFIQRTISLYQNEEKTKKIEQIQVEAQIGDYYFYQSKNNEYDFFIAIYKSAEQKLYTFEWHQ